MLRVKIDDGGTNAGNRPPLAEQRHDTWRCSEGHDNKPNHTRCMTSGCNERRPS